MANSGMRAGGSLIALGTIAGTIGGGLAGQPSAGLLAGAAAGALGALAVWVVDRRRDRTR